MKVDKGLINLFIINLFIYCFNVLKWRCKTDHAFSTPKLGVKKREREREKKTFLRDSKKPKSREHKGQRITLPYRPYTHCNPSKDIDLRHALFPRG